MTFQGNFIVAINESKGLVINKQGWGEGEWGVCGVLKFSIENDVTILSGGNEISCPSLSLGLA